MKIIDNFLPEHEFKRLESCIMSKHIPWYYNPGVDLPQFTHVMFEENPSSDWFDIVHPIIDKIFVRMLFKVKANLTTRTAFNRFTGYHVDWRDKTPDAYTSILYLNTNNGGTKFKGYDTIKSVANRFVTFNSSIEHGGITCTDQKRRVVLNFNYLL
jgi:hypothetical protein